MLKNVINKVQVFWASYLKSFFINLVSQSGLLLLKNKEREKKIEKRLQENHDVTYPLNEDL